MNCTVCNDTGASLAPDNKMRPCPKCSGYIHEDACHTCEMPLDQCECTGGYTDCACRDCFEIAIGKSGKAMCHACEEAGCEAGEHECCAPGAYEADD